MIQRAAFLPDLLLTVPIILLLSLGTLVIFSSDSKLAVQQGIFAVIGLLGYWFLSWINFEYYRSYFKYLYFGVLFLLIIVFLLGVETRGSIRWIPLGDLQLQPSEFAKPVLILYLAKYWTSHFPSWKNIIKSFLLIAPVVVLVFKQPDLGTTLTLLAIWLIMLIAANISFVKLAAMLVVLLSLSPLLWLLLKNYQRARILSFLSPAQDPLGIGYNVIQSTIAVGSGQLWGRGLGRGTQSRLQFLPEFRTDFIFASIAEEFGFIGSVIVLSLYGLLLGRALKIAATVNRFNNLIIFGVLGMLIFQIMVNIGMNIGLIPITGITLPLLSYGGSSLVTTLLSLGLVASSAKVAGLNKPSPQD